MKSTGTLRTTRLFRFELFFFADMPTGLKRWFTTSEHDLLDAHRVARVSR
jgi:hypothetical protein